MSDSSETEDEDEWRGYEEAVVGSSASDSGEDDDEGAKALPKAASGSFRGQDLDAAPSAESAVEYSGRSGQNEGSLLDRMGELETAVTHQSAAIARIEAMLQAALKKG